MDYSGMAMPDSGQITGNDIRDTLLGAGAVFTLPAGAVNANYAPNYFSEGAKLNKWSKYKPVKNKGDFYHNLITDKESWPNPITGVTESYFWWQGRPRAYETTISGIGNVTTVEFCGVKVPLVYNATYAPILKTIIDTYANNGLNWEQVPIEDDADQKYPRRMGDFRGYMAKVAPVFDYYVKDRVYIGDNEMATFQMWWQDEGTHPGAWGLNDVPWLSNFRALAVIYKGTVHMASLIGKEILGNPETANGEELTISALSGGDYTVYLGLIDTSRNIFIPLPKIGTSLNKSPIRSFTMIPGSNPANNPMLNGQIVTSWGRFAARITGTLYETFPNMDSDSGGGTMHIAGMGSWLFSFRFKNTGTTPYTLVEDDIKLHWFYSGTTTNIIDSKMYKANSTSAGDRVTSMVIPAGETVELFFTSDSIFTATDGTRYIPSNRQMMTDQYISFMHRNTIVFGSVFQYEYNTQYPNGAIWNGSQYIL